MQLKCTSMLSLKLAFICEFVSYGPAFVVHIYSICTKYKEYASWFFKIKAFCFLQMLDWQEWINVNTYLFFWVLGRQTSTKKLFYFYVCTLHITRETCIYSPSLSRYFSLSSNFISQFDLDFVESILFSQDYLILCFYQLFSSSPNPNPLSPQTRLCVCYLLMHNPPKVNQL